MNDKWIRVAVVAVTVIAVASASYYAYAYMLADTENVDFGSYEFHPKDSADIMHSGVPSDDPHMSPSLFLRYQSAPYGNKWFLYTSVAFYLGHGFGLESLRIEYSSDDESVRFIDLSPKGSNHVDGMNFFNGIFYTGDYLSRSAEVEYMFVGDARSWGDTISNVGPVFFADRETDTVKCVVTADFVRTDGIQKDHIIQTWEATVHLDVHDDSKMPIVFPFPGDKWFFGG